MLRDAPSIAFSLSVHAVLLVILAFLYLPASVDFKPDLFSLVEEVETLDTTALFPAETEEPVELDVDVAAFFPVESAVEPVTEWTPLDIVPETPKTEITVTDFGDILSTDSLMAGLDTLSTGGLSRDFSSRTHRGATVAQGGGSEASEQAVALALRWLVDHQLPNGAWCYTQLRNPNCRGQCRDIAVEKANGGLISATALALLPMLGAGITHKEGRYKEQVQAGLAYIASNSRHGPEGIVLCEIYAQPEMYHHALAAIVIAEAAAMTRDKDLERLAQGAIHYIVWAQDPVGGGWRYTPRQPGDTSGLGWNFMALQSARMGRLQVPPQAFKGTKHFLDNVTGIEKGAYYGYLDNTPPTAQEKLSPSLTAIGLLCQMYLGWPADHPSLVKGTDFLAETGPLPDDIYYNYYATQVMHHLGGTKWDRWNKIMRDSLVERQVKNGHEQGSWDFVKQKNIASGGRLTTTALATMILEVYYRHMPLYQRTTNVEDFPLE